MKLIICLNQGTLTVLLISRTSEILLYQFSYFSLCIFNILITNLLFYNIKNMPASLSYSEKIKKKVKKKAPSYFFISKVTVVFLFFFMI